MWIYDITIVPSPQWGLLYWYLSWLPYIWSGPKQLNSLSSDGHMASYSLVNIGSWPGYGLLHDGTNALPEPMSTCYHWIAVAFSCKQFRSVTIRNISKWNIFEVYTYKTVVTFHMKHWVNGTFLPNAWVRKTNYILSRFVIFALKITRDIKVTVTYLSCNLL